MKTIRMKTLAIGPFGSFEAGRTYEVQDEFSAILVDGGYAELLAVAEPVVETATIEEAELETATVTPRRRGKGKA